MIGQKESVEYFIDKGISLKEDPPNGKHSLHHAIYQNQTDIAMRLAPKVRDSLDNRDTYHKYKPIELAAFRKNDKLFDYLIKLGAD